MKMSLSSDEEKMNVTGAKRAAPVESQGRCGKVRENRMMGKQIQREKRKGWMVCMQPSRW